MKNKIALFNDLSCYGKTSITMQMPIISSFGDIPSFAFNSYLTNAYSMEHKEKFTTYDNFNTTLTMWQKNNIIFDGFITGYIDNPKDILNVREFIVDNKLTKEKSLALVDPVFADEGKNYCAITDEHIDNYKKLMEVSDIITPNLTEACILAGENYDDYKDKFSTAIHEPKDKIKTNDLSKKILEAMLPLLDKLRFKKNQITIITGIHLYNSVMTLLDVYDGDHGKRQSTCNFSEKVGGNFLGCGDLFDAMFYETATNGFNLVDALSVTTSFINNTLRFTRDQKFEVSEGIVYEPILVDNVLAMKKKLKEINESITKQI